MVSSGLLEGCPWAKLRPPPVLHPFTETGLWHHPRERASPGGPEGRQAVPSRCSLYHFDGGHGAGALLLPAVLSEARPHTTLQKTQSSCGL